MEKMPKSVMIILAAIVGLLVIATGVASVVLILRAF